MAPRPRLKLYFAQTQPPSPSPSLDPLAQGDAYVQSRPRVRMPSAVETFDYGKDGQTTVKTLIGGEQIFNAIEDVLSKAKHFVASDIYTLQNLALDPDRSSPPGTRGYRVQTELIDRFIALQKRGVDVKMVIDNHLERGRDKDGIERQNDKAIELLRKNGVDVMAYPDFSAISHVKVLIVDNRYAVVGGMNWGNHSATNHDAALLIEGPDVRNIYNTIFKYAWLSTGRAESEIPKADPFDAGKITVLKTTSRHSAEGAHDDVYREILKQIAQAKDSIYAQLFVLTQKDVVDNLLLAHQRLVKAGKEGVKILVDPGLFFSFPNVRPGIQKLAAEGVPIRFFQSDRNIEEKLHSKWAVFDHKKVLIGSANWSNVGLLSDRPAKEQEGGKTRRVSKGNREMALLVESPNLARPFVQQALYDWRHNSFPILEWRDGKYRPIVPQVQAEAPVFPKRTAAATTGNPFAERYPNRRRA